jgi:flagellar motor switch protein FliG
MDIVFVCFFLLRYRISGLFVLMKWQQACSQRLGILYLSTSEPLGAWIEMESDIQNRLGGQKKIAMFVSMLESNTLARLLKQLNDRERLQVIEAYQNFSYDAPASTPDLAGVAKSFLETKAMSAPNHFKEALEIAFGPGAAMRFGSSTQWAEIAERVKPAAMAEFLNSERANTIAIVLSQLPPSYAAEMLPLLAEERRCAAIDILASGLNLSNGVLDAVLSAVQENLDSIKLIGDSGQGARQVAAMLNQVDYQVADDIVERIRQRDPNCATSIKEEMFHFEDLVKLDNHALQMILAEVKPERLALAMKGTPPAAREAVFAALAEQVKKMVVQEMEDLGKVPGRDVRAARREVIDLALQMSHDGKIRLRQAGDLVE